jgi:small subunit ribosomal protein S1
MVHVSEILADKRVERPQDVLRTGQVVQAKVLEIDATKRQIKLSMKQLIPTGLDEYIAEHKAGDTVTARIVKLEGTSARIELGEGIYATCTIKAAEPVAEEPKATGAVDLSAFSSMLKDKWKGGSSTAKPKSEAPQQGQIRKFRIANLDTENKSIAVELIS